jgi:pyridoxamine 5'-phosphate oxidase
MAELLAQALARFADARVRARASGLAEPDAMTLSTVDAQGWPRARVVLLKAADERGFVFYTNTRSRKGEDLAHCPRAALTFFWPPLLEQVMVDGGVQPVAGVEADAYWASRPRLSQIASSVSRQSQWLDSREAFAARMAEYDARLAGGPVPRPDHWSGYRVIPHRIEFWRGVTGRMNERDCYELGPEGWSLRQLQP